MGRWARRCSYTHEQSTRQPLFFFEREGGKRALFPRCRATEESHLPFGFARALVSDDADVADLAAASLREELVDLALVCLQVDAAHQHRAVVALRLFCLTLGFI